MASFSFRPPYLFANNQLVIEFYAEWDQTLFRKFGRRRQFCALRLTESRVSSIPAPGLVTPQFVPLSVQLQIKVQFEQVLMTGQSFRFSECRNMSWHRRFGGTIFFHFKVTKYRLETLYSVALRHGRHVEWGVGGGRNDNVEESDHTAPIVHE